MFSVGLSEKSLWYGAEWVSNGCAWIPVICFPFVQNSQMHYVFLFMPFISKSKLYDSGFYSQEWNRILSFAARPVFRYLKWFIAWMFYGQKNAFCQIRLNSSWVTVAHFFLADFEVFYMKAEHWRANGAPRNVAFPVFLGGFFDRKVLIEFSRSE